MNRGGRIGGAVTGLALALALVAGLPSLAGAQLAAPACTTVDPTAGNAQMAAYGAAAPPTARQVDRRSGMPASVSVQLPVIAFDGPGSSPSLPVGPCQTIYRFAYPAIQIARGSTRTPFAYAEVDWNTEGLPRGPNNSFTSPHFDFHFYLRPRHWVDHRTMCPSANGRTCNEVTTPYAQMRRFMDLPASRFLPAGFFPDTGSEIPMMGTHILDGAATYTVDAVNHSPTLIYGSYGGEMLFAESSVTLYTLQDAMNAPSHEVSFAYRSPPRVHNGRPWPTRFVVRYLPATGGFTGSFEGFRRFPR
ncbi:MAG: hypothetical protein JWP17_1220 [Solirubrobacterales bacterium]|nr:hypothetical protein [Solirubrobacterales bacterium]